MSFVGKLLLVDAVFLVFVYGVLSFAEWIGKFVHTRQSRQLSVVWSSIFFGFTAEELDKPLPPPWFKKMMMIIIINALVFINVIIMAIHLGNK